MDRITKFSVCRYFCVYGIHLAYRNTGETYTNLLVFKQATISSKKPWQEYKDFARITHCVQQQLRDCTMQGVDGQQVMERTGYCSLDGVRSNKCTSMQRNKALSDLFSCQGNLLSGASFLTSTTAQLCQRLNCLTNSSSYPQYRCFTHFQELHSTTHLTSKTVL